MRHEALSYLFGSKVVIVDICAFLDFDDVLPLPARNSLRSLPVYNLNIDTFNSIDGKKIVNRVIGSRPYFDPASIGAVFQHELTSTFPSLKLLHVSRDHYCCFTQACLNPTKELPYLKSPVTLVQLMESRGAKWLARKCGLESFRFEGYWFCLRCSHGDREHVAQ